jgi:hypothetical protein
MSVGLKCEGRVPGTIVPVGCVWMKLDVASANSLVFLCFHIYSIIAAEFVGDNRRVHFSSYILVKSSVATSAYC